MEEKINLGKKFELVQTLEVAEHLSPERAESFVEDLTNLGDVVLFSAAILGQGGTNHVNEQMQSYWVEKFLQRDYVCIDCLRPQIWTNPQIDSYYRQNIFLYVKRTELYHYPEMQKYYLENREHTIYDAVHPEIWVGRLQAFQNFYNQLQAQATFQNNGGGGGTKPPLHSSEKILYKNFSVKRMIGKFLFLTLLNSAVRITKYFLKGR